ncbi:hypothetical protein BOX15_Mlig006593g1, partial [Macrostomum lignano]
AAPATDSNATGIEAEFQLYLNQLAADLATVESVKATAAELTKLAQLPLQALRCIHRSCDSDSISKAIDEARAALQPSTDLLAKLGQQMPAGTYYKYHQLWREPVQQLCMAVTFISFLESDRLLSLEDAASQLGMAGDSDGGGGSTLHLDLEDYLFGLLLLASELARLSVNAVTAGRPDLPRRVADFARHLEAGFRLLNFKNDALRRRYDGLKYDMRKIEEVLYDVTVRKLE